MEQIKPVTFKPNPRAGKSPTERTLKFLRELGYESGIVERRPIPNRNISVDLFHIIDIIAIAPGQHLGIQSTGQDYSGHLEKLTIKHAVDSAKWIRSGSGLYIIAWRKRQRNHQQYWDPRIKQILFDDLIPALTAQSRLDVLNNTQRPFIQTTE